MLLVIWYNYFTTAVFYATPMDSTVCLLSRSFRKFYNDLMDFDFALATAVFDLFYETVLVSSYKFEKIKFKTSKLTKTGQSFTCTTLLQASSH